MDEILASIRKIIETTDAGPATPRRAAPDAPVEIEVTPDVHGSGSPETQWRPPLSELQSAQPAGSGAFPDIDVGPSDDDELESIDASFEVAYGQGTVPEAGNENSLQADDGFAHDRAPVHDFTFDFDTSAFEEDLRGGIWDAPETGVEAATEHARPEPVAIEFPSAEAIRGEMPESVIDGASALLSAQAGDQVAAAFDDLTRAIRDGHMRSMEGLAREMLRPMLQEWLDENLPRIVERLVRDEIERIARGQRR